MPSALPDGDPAPPDGRLPGVSLATLAERPFGVYLHVPFCRVRCGYCDFNTYTLLELGPEGAGVSTFADAALNELALAGDVLGPDVPGVRTVFVGGGTWRQYGVLSRADRKRAVLEGFAAMFGEQALHPIDYVEHDWTKERWTTGGPVANYAPGTMLQFGSAIRKPFGRVHWAGTETSTYWTGYMDGAVRAGQRAAAEVRALLH